MRNPVTVRKLKYDGYVKREWTGDLVEALGDWLVVYSTPARHVQVFEGKPVARLKWPHQISLFNTRQPLAIQVFFDARGIEDHRYVDAALPATIAGRDISYVDLDLDIEAPPGEPAWVKDLEAFEKRRRELAYPDEVVDAAWLGIRIGTELLANGRFPFDGSASALLGRILASEGPL